MHIWRLFGFAVWALILMGIFIGAAHGKSIARAEGQGVVITLFDEPCRSDIQGLPLRAEWLEGGKVTQGCWGVQDDLIVSYWNDKTVTVIRAMTFRPLTSL